MADIKHLGLFPWCVNQETSYFKGIDVSTKAVPIWWRVKEWTLNGEFVRQSNTTPPQIETFNFSQILKVTDLKKNIVTEDKFKKEADLVCAGIFYDEEANTTNRIPADHIWGIDGGEIFIDSVIKIGPHLQFSFNQDDMIGADSSGNEDKVGEINITMDSVEFAVELFLTSQVPNPPPLFQIVSLNGTLSATEYWPYDPNDGLGPIYNNTTGEQLRSF